jgi:uronate dehydrogenase
MTSASLSVPSFNRLLLTGAAGALGRALRPALPSVCKVLRVSDITDLGTAAAHEEAVNAPLQDAAAVLALLDGVDAVVHLGGISVDGPWEPILQANIIGMHNLYEAARRQGVRRIVYASSNHVTGFYGQHEVIDARLPARPDSNYGVSKAFGENLAQFYFDRYGVETVSLRIGSSFPEPVDRRMLSTWLSYADLERLVIAALTAPVVGHSIVYGISANRSAFWDNTPARHIGYLPQDSSEPYRAALEAAQPVLDRSDRATLLQGGGYVVKGPYV